MVAVLLVVMNSFSPPTPPPPAAAAVPVIGGGPLASKSGLPRTRPGFKSSIVLGLIATMLAPIGPRMKWGDVTIRMWFQTTFQGLRNTKRKSTRR